LSYFDYFVEFPRHVSLLHGLDPFRPLSGPRFCPLVSLWLPDTLDRGMEYFVGESVPRSLLPSPHYPNSWSAWHTMLCVVWGRAVDYVDPFMM